MSVQLLPDAMHDVLEGGIAFVLEQVLKGLISTRVLESTCVDVISEFEFGFHDKKSKPPCAIRADGKLKGTASQKWCLFRLLPQLLGDDIPEGNRHWELYLKYREIVNVILADTIPEDAVAFLEVLVDEFLSQFVNLHPGSKLTPKLHYLVHYPRLIRMFGPPRRYWSMRFVRETSRTCARRWLHDIKQNSAMHFHAFSSMSPSARHVERSLIGNHWTKLRDLFPEQPTPDEAMYSVKSATFQINVNTEMGTHTALAGKRSCQHFQIFLMIVF